MQKSRLLTFNRLDGHRLAGVERCPGSPGRCEPGGVQSPGRRALKHTGILLMVDDLQYFTAAGASAGRSAFWALL